MFWNKLSDFNLFTIQIFVSILLVFYGNEKNIVSIIIMCIKQKCKLDYENWSLIFDSKNNCRFWQAKRMKLIGPMYQWLYVIVDTQSLNYDMTPFLEKVEDGDNVAFAFNKSVQSPTSSCNVSSNTVNFTKQCDENLENWNSTNELGIVRSLNQFSFGFHVNFF